MAVAHFHASHWIGQTGGGGGDPLDTPSLSIVDNEDGTGVVATVSDSDPASTNTFYYQSFDDIGTDEWTAGGNRGGDGDITVSLSTGHYLGYILSTTSTQSAASTPWYFVVTDSSDEAVLYQVLTAVKSRIQALSLSGITNASVVAKKLPLERIFRESDGIDLPCVLVTPQRETMNAMAGTNAQDDVGYGVLVTIVRGDNQEPTLAANLDAFALWRQKITKAFRNQRLAGVDEIVTCAVEPADFLVPAAWMANLLVGALLLRFTSRESRGLS